MISSFYCTKCGRGLESWECSGQCRSFSLERLYCPDCRAPARTSGPWLLFVGCGILLGSFLEIPGDAFPFPHFCRPRRALLVVWCLACQRPTQGQKTSSKGLPGKPNSRRDVTLASNV